MLANPDLRLSVWMIPAWLAALAIGYRMRARTEAITAAEPGPL
jgi:aromatic amino acid transport protein AroP